MLVSCRVLLVVSRSVACLGSVLMYTKIIFQTNRCFDFGHQQSSIYFQFVSFRFEALRVKFLVSRDGI